MAANANNANSHTRTHIHTSGASTSIRPEYNSWPTNVANMRHTVDFRRSWVPSPEILGRGGVEMEVEGGGRGRGDGGHLAHPNLAVSEDALLLGPGSTSRSASDGHYYHSSARPAHAATRTAPARRWYGSEEKRAGQTKLPQTATTVGAAATYGDGPSFTRTRACTRSQARERDSFQPYQHMRVDVGPAMGLGLGLGLGMERENGQRGCGRECECDNGWGRELARERERDCDRDRGQEKRKSWLSLLSPKKLLLSRKSRSNVADDDEYQYQYQHQYQDATIGQHWIGSGPRREIHPSEWRAYGAWARPLIGKPWWMVVHNATPIGPPRELSPPQVDAMFASLLEPSSGERHPENWIPRVEHCSLPPRPDLWPTPRQTYDPLPGTLQLNPFLEHRLVGRPPLHFDLRLRVQDIMLGELPPSENAVLPGPHQYAAATATTNVDANANANSTSDAGPSTNPNRTGVSSEAPGEPRLLPFWSDGPNGAQPATYPGVPRLRITALAEDAQREFPWPVTVLPHHEALPVLVSDVLNALIANFEERMTDDEVYALSSDRMFMLYQAYWRRIRMPIGGSGRNGNGGGGDGDRDSDSDRDRRRKPPEDDGLRRVDYLGDAIYFRGLAPNPSGDGFVLFMGAPP